MSLVVHHPNPESFVSCVFLSVNLIKMVWNARDQAWQEWTIPVGTAVPVLMASPTSRFNLSVRKRLKNGMHARARLFQIPSVTQTSHGSHPSRFSVSCPSRIKTIKDDDDGGFVVLPAAGECPSLRGKLFLKKSCCGRHVCFEIVLSRHK